jgi:hypothetical protein
MKTAPWLMGLAGCVAAAVYVEWHTDEVTVVLATLVLGAAMLGAAKPSLAPVAGAALGFSILTAHVLTEALGRFRPHYMHEAPRPVDWAAMAAAGLAVTAVAWGAGTIRSKV